jgi:hypothetical protein
MNIAMRVLLAVDQGLCLITTGQNDFTISAWAYVRTHKHGKSGWNKFIDSLFFWQDSHCEHAFLWEWESAKQMCEKFDVLYEKTYFDKFGKHPRNVSA